MYQITKQERMALLKQGEQARFFYRLCCALAPAAVFVAVVALGFFILGG